MTTTNAKSATADVVAAAEASGVRYLDLQFTDVMGSVKTVTIPADQLPAAVEHGALSGYKSRAVTQQVDSLCFETRQEAVSLVDSFGIPDSCLSAPIAL